MPGSQRRRGFRKSAGSGRRGTATGNYRGGEGSWGIEKLDVLRVPNLREFNKDAAMTPELEKILSGTAPPAGGAVWGAIGALDPCMAHRLGEMTLPARISMFWWSWMDR